MGPVKPALSSFFAACLLVAGAAGAAELRITAPSAPGSASDQLARALKTALSDERGEPVVEVTNVPGAGGTVGLAQFLSERSEGALLVTGLTMVDATFLHRSPTPLGRLTPIARLSAEPFAVAVPTASALRSMADLTAAFTADPARITWAGGRAGSIEHVATVLLAGALGIDAGRLSYVHFLNGAEAAATLPDSPMAAAMLPLGDVAPEVKAGRLRILALSSPGRVEAVDAPSLAELGIRLELSNWRGVVARPGIRPDERERLVATIDRLAASPAWKEMLGRRGWQDGYLAPEAFGVFIANEQTRVKSALKTLGLLKGQPD